MKYKAGDVITGKTDFHSYGGVRKITTGKKYELLSSPLYSNPYIELDDGAGITMIYGEPPSQMFDDPVGGVDPFDYAMGII